MAVTVIASDIRGNDNGHIFAEISFTAAGTSDAFDLSFLPVHLFSMQASVPNGIPISWTAVLEGSIDGAHFDTILSNTNLIGLSVLQVSSQTLVRYVRVRVPTLVLGTAPSLTVDILGAM